MSNLSTIRGNREDILLTVTLDGVPMNLDSVAVRLLFKLSYADADAAAVITLNSSGGGITPRAPQSDPANTGKADVVILPTQMSAAGLLPGITTTLIFEIRLFNGATWVKTPEQGSLVVGRDAIRAIA